MLSNSQIEKFRSILQQQKKSIIDRLEETNELNLSAGHFRESMGELSTYDNHPADEGTELFERGKDLALKEHYQTELMKIEKALKAIENGTYGKCEVCGKEIPIERLEALPATTFCKDHSPNPFTSNDRPIEEEIMEPSIHNFYFDEDEENVAFDREDAWQEVESWGTSETPSDFLVPEDNDHEISVEKNENIGYVEDFENFVGIDMNGKITIFPNEEHEHYEEALDEEGIMTPFGDLPAKEKEPYVEDHHSNHEK